MRGLVFQDRTDGINHSNKTVLVIKAILVSEMDVVLNSSLVIYGRPGVSKNNQLPKISKDTRKVIL